MLVFMYKFLADLQFYVFQTVGANRHVIHYTEHLHVDLLLPVVIVAL